MAEQYVYFSKVNLNSIDVYDVQKNENQYSKIADAIFHSLKSDLSFINSQTYIDSNGELGMENTEYSLNIINRDEISIEGVLYKTSYLYAKSIDKQTKEIRVNPVSNTEDITFYYDVLHEYVGFHVRRRFGRNQFNTAFAEMLNTAMKRNDYPYSFGVETYNAGISLNDLKNELKQIKDLKRLVLTFQPVNPDAEILQLMEAAGDECNAMKELEEANATYKSIIYESRGLGSLNTESKIIQDDLDVFEQMHSAINTQKLTQRGYTKVETMDSYGNVVTTADRSPYRKRIFRESELIAACKKGISSILRKDNYQSD